jgi:oxygen-independent coproporphyrinogen-3 oxidase
MKPDAAPVALLHGPAGGGAPALRFAAPPPLGLYVHLPWCVRKCPYCDFNSHELREALPAEAYVDALIADLERELPLVWGRTVQTIFIGGGTPSLFPARAVERLISAVRARLRVAPGAEITLEANPGAVEADRMREFRDAGVNRISLGIQSLDDDLLRRLGRIHDAGEARAAVEAVREAGFAAWNLDLMYGLPGQSVAGAVADVREAVALGPPHLSHYQLTIEPNTVFHHRPPERAADDELWDMQVRCQAELAAAGYVQYEVSAYARQGMACAHNVNYWTFGDYLGIGAGAHAKLTQAGEPAVHRRIKVRHPRDYLRRAADGDPLAEDRELAAADLGLEFMMNALRLNDGFATALFQERTGLPLALFERPLGEAERLGLIGRDLGRIWPTERGRRYLDDLVMLFLPDD